MIGSSKEQITNSQAGDPRQLYSCAGILTLPRTSVEKVKTPDVWITVILGGMIAMLVALIIVKLNQRFPGKPFINITRKL